MDPVADEMTCAGCGEPIAEDQTALRLTAGVATEARSFSGLLMRPDVYLHAGTPSNGPWGDEPNGERWCATPENLARALALLRVHAMTGASGGMYHGE